MIGSADASGLVLIERPPWEQPRLDAIASSARIEA